MVADMEVDKFADMVADMAADKKANIEVDKVAGNKYLEKGGNIVDGRVRENHGGDILIVCFQVSSIVEDSLNKDSACADGHGGQCHLICYIANSVDACNGRVLEFIDLNSASGDFDASVG